MSSNAVETRAEFLRLINNRFRFQFFLLKKLPAAFFSGLRLEAATEDCCSISVPYKWFTQNPFRSTYFACMSMAAEMSTGILAMSNIYKRHPQVSMLVLTVESNFYKKAVGKTIFTCKEGRLIQQAVEKAINSGEAQSVAAHSIGYNSANERIAEVVVTWSFKARY